MKRAGRGWMVLLLLASGLPVVGQSAKAAAFEAVTIKPSSASLGNWSIDAEGDRFSASGVSVKNLLMQAYDLKMESQISALTGPAAGARFDIEAKMDEETLSALRKLPREQRNAQDRLMMQGLLEDRFKLKVHHETKELPMYFLVIAKGGAKLKAAASAQEKEPDGTPRDNARMSIHNTSMVAEGVSSANLAESLIAQVERVVVDRTGLTGRYDFTLEWSNGQERASSGSDNGLATEARPSIFTALQEQLGLRLEAGKGPVDTIIVDRIEMPSAN